jgi:hypothetical protein
MSNCNQTIWVGKFKDNYGAFEILVPACSKDEAFDKIRSSIDKIKSGKRKIIKPGINNEDMMYLEEVGEFDYEVREDYEHK